MLWGVSLRVGVGWGMTLWGCYCDVLVGTGKIRELLQIVSPVIIPRQSATIDNFTELPRDRRAMHVRLVQGRPYMDVH